MRRVAIVVYDVTAFTERELDNLILEAAAQGEPSDGHDDEDPGHPNANVSVLVVDVPAHGRAVLVRDTGVVENLDSSLQPTPPIH